MLKIKKYFMWCLLGSCLGLLGWYAYRLNAQKRVSTGIVYCSNPKIIRVFESIKSHLGIQEQVELCLIQDESVFAMYEWGSDRVLINLENMDNDPVQLIHSLVHELGHHMQYHNYPRLRCCRTMVHDLLYKDLSCEQQALISYALEEEADEIAASFFDCPHCLYHLSKTVDTPFVERAKSVIWGIDPRSAKGYFDRCRYKPFLKKTKKAKLLCHAHDCAARQMVTLKIEDSCLDEADCFLSCQSQMHDSAQIRLKI